MTSRKGTKTITGPCLKHSRMGQCASNLQAIRGIHKQAENRGEKFKTGSVYLKKNNRFESYLNYENEGKIDFPILLSLLLPLWARSGSPRLQKKPWYLLLLFYFFCLCLPQQVTPCFLPPVPSGRYPPSPPAASEQPTWEALWKTAKKS